MWCLCLTTYQNEKKNPALAHKQSSLSHVRCLPFHTTSSAVPEFAALRSIEPPSFHGLKVSGVCVFCM